MQRRNLGLALAASLCCVCAQPGPPGPRPKLLLTIVVDQFRYDYLTRFRTEYTQGFQRLLTQGAVFTNAYYEHVPTVTAIGHSTIMTGASPMISGIVSNEWYDRETGRIVTSVSDPQRGLLGAQGEASSPHRLMVSTVGDELKLSGKGESKVIGLSIKDRSAILPAGRMADASYWFSNEAGVFVSSSWYMKELPEWVKAFNARKAGERFLGKPWLPMAGGPPLHVMPSVPDTMFYSNVERSPFGNELLEEFAEAAIAAERLGSHSNTDFLSISFSSNDYVGHAFGPDSAEARDISIRTDRTLGKLFAYLEKQVGMANILVVLTADHGVAPIPEISRDRKMPGGRLKDAEYMAVVDHALGKAFEPGKWAVGKKAEQLFLDPALTARHGPEKVRAVAAAALGNLPHILRVYTREQILQGLPAYDLIARRVTQGYHSVRGPDVVAIAEPYYIFSSDRATHGTPYSYDAHVPLILMGPGIRAGRYHGAAAVNDIAPTVATVLEVEVPAGSMGRVLVEALQR
jgi:predicted AlkP superfamily pyrophosphatase or phosphodiesterase